MEILGSSPSLVGEAGARPLPEFRNSEQSLGPEGNWQSRHSELGEAGALPPPRF